MNRVIDELVVAYKSTKDEKVFNQLFKLVKDKILKSSNSIYGTKEDKEDLFQWSCISLLRAIETWDPVEAVAKNSCFENYLSLCCWHDKVAVAGRNPSCSEPMFDKNRVNFTIRVNGLEGSSRDTTKLSLNAVVEDEENGSEEVTFEDLLVDERDSVERPLVAGNFVSMLIDMAEEGVERLVVASFVEGNNLTEIAKEMGYSIAKVSLILKSYREKVQKEVAMEKLEDLMEMLSSKQVVGIQEY